MMIVLMLSVWGMSPCLGFSLWLLLLRLEQ